MSREKAYEKIQSHAMEVRANRNEKLKDRLLSDPDVNTILTENDFKEIFDINPYLSRIGLIYDRLGLNL